MTKKEIMNVVKNIRNYLMSGNPIWDKDTVYEALSTAIDALERTDTHECVDPTHACDLISRAAAIDVFEDTTFTKNEIRRRLSDLPSAQPERKKGKWVPYLPEGLRYKCSECGSRYDTPWHFCPHCGSYNGGESDDKG